MISCKTLTYGRTHLLEEALNSFLLQDFEGESELIIVNDYPLQKLIFDHPRVKIYNLDKTFPIIGQKENFAIEMCSGDIIVTFDDDDIALPWHFKNIMKYWYKNADLLFWSNAVYYNEPGITNITGVGNSGFIFSKRAWEIAGKSPIENAGGDMTFVNKIKEFGNVIYAFPPNDEVSWFYRWSLPQNGGCYHQSGQGHDVPGRPNIVQRNAAHVENLRKRGLIPTGDVHLEPKWNRDYNQMLKDYIKSK